MVIIGSVHPFISEPRMGPLLTLRCRFSSER
jgi:hypothetical protein